MKRETINGSSNIAEIGYLEKSQTLQIKFHSGGIYSYNPVSKSVFKELMEAPSKGSYFHKNILKNPSITFKKVG